ncbi:hypothetical protein [Terrimonas pollutisoli]|uniref:hypothetical protein n=1 Tax=Terrimonas pollutisoli TaxID=3034147 RepID=UPI0023ED050C|nr:hypothetical protein [Terrimonas sp. H1YJ31]
MDISIILIIVVLGVYLVWKLMGSGPKKKPRDRRFNIRKHRQSRKQDDEDDLIP